jgi:hypothetical protein
MSFTLSREGVYLWLILGEEGCVGLDGYVAVQTEFGLLDHVFMTE